VSAVPLLAQWPDYPTANVPRDAKGKPDLNGPTPKAADGHPDLSGVWGLARMGGGRAGAAAAGGPPPGGPPPPQAAGATPPPAGGPGPGGPPAPPREFNGYSTFFDVGAGLKDGLPLLPGAAALLKQRKAENSKDNPDAHCLPLGVMQLHTHGQPRKIVQNPGVIVIMYEANSGLRQIFTDGRPMPKDPEPWWYGYSIGKWAGDTLVVESAHFRDLGWLDVEGSPLTDQGRIIERFRRPDFGHLEIEVTIDDPKAYTKPWTVTVYQRILPDTDLIEFVCQENDKAGPHLVGK
jgi:hypothetical protein